MGHLNTVVGLAAGAFLIAAGVAGITAPNSNPEPSAMSYIVLPHPDDEWQAWSLIENSPANYKVFISTTEGEQSGYCDLPREGTHPRPMPYPTGKWTPECGDARMNSWLGFLTKMSEHDPTIPGDWGEMELVGPLPAIGFDLSTDDGGVVAPANRMARVWVDDDDRGAAISFDLGDGDLTVQEVEWAVRTVMNNRDELGIDDDLPIYNIIGTFAHNGSYGAQCALYTHPDHRAVHVALYSINFGVTGYQTAATCSTDPDEARTKLVSFDSTVTAWNGPEFAFQTNYGWLGGYPITYYQDKLFMRTQSFWTRF